MILNLNSPLFDSRSPSSSPSRPSRKRLGRRTRSPRTPQPPYCSVQGRDPARMLSRTTDTSGSVRPLAGTDSIARFCCCRLDRPEEDALCCCLGLPDRPDEVEEMRHLEGHEGGSCTATEPKRSRPEVAEWSAEDVEFRRA